MTEISGWKTAEYIAALFEKILSPDAKVEHNVFLPVVGRPDRKPRQCDVVVTYGRQPRTSIAIVEVQKRNRKPEITIFHGWVAKMREVGAQHLICVSEHGYPRSIIDEVALVIGPTVKLMTLRQLEQGDDITRLVTLPFMLETQRSFSLISTGIIKVKGARDQLGQSQTEALRNVSSVDAIFSVGRNGPHVSLNDLVAIGLANANIDPRPPMSESAIEAELLFQAEHDIWFHSSTGPMQVMEWPVRAKVSFKTTKRALPKIDTAHLVYRQEFIAGVVAWIATVKVEVKGRQIEFRVAFKRDPDGYLTYAGNVLTHA